ncbi:MAG: hypothetical protein ABIF71_09785 [Planctomycetota bacterium]
MQVDHRRQAGRIAGVGPGGRPHEDKQSEADDRPGLFDDQVQQLFAVRIPQAVPVQGLRRLYACKRGQVHLRGLTDIELLFICVHLLCIQN